MNTFVSIKVHVICPFIGYRLYPLLSYVPNPPNCSWISIAFPCGVHHHDPGYLRSPSCLCPIPSTECADCYHIRIKHRCSTGSFHGAPAQIYRWGDIKAPTWYILIILPASDSIGNRASPNPNRTRLALTFTMSTDVLLFKFCSVSCMHRLLAQPLMQCHGERKLAPVVAF